MTAMRASIPNRTRGHAGFTLAELMITIGLIALLFGIVFMKLDHIVPGQRLTSAARTLANHLDLARNYAILSGKPVKFEYDLDHHVYRYYVPFQLSENGRDILGPGEFEIRDWTELDDTIVFKDVLLVNEAATSGLVTVTFEPRGIASDHVVHIGYADVDVREAAASVFVSPLFGHIDVYDKYREPEVLQKSAF
jgi:prepilin-type N-terminal cleavage/methylation domain-containing protein